MSLSFSSHPNQPNQQFTPSVPSKGGSRRIRSNVNASPAGTSCKAPVGSPPEPPLRPQPFIAGKKPVVRDPGAFSSVLPSPSFLIDMRITSSSIPHPRQNQITSLFACPNILPATYPSSFHPPLSAFIACALQCTGLPDSVTISALLLLWRIKIEFPGASGSSGHRLFISAFMVASKVLCDAVYSNKTWCIVAQQMFALDEINLMERQFLAYLEWNVVVSGEEIAGFNETLRTKLGLGFPAPTNLSAPSFFALHPQVPTLHITPSSTASVYPSPPSSPTLLSYSASSNPSPTSSLGYPCAPHLESSPPNYDAAQSGPQQEIRRASSFASKRIKESKTKLANTRRRHEHEPA